jgi:hypothetical protein
MALPLTSAAGATVTLSISNFVSDTPDTFSIKAYNGASWSVLVSTVLGGPLPSTWEATGIAWTAAYTHYSFGYGDTDFTCAYSILPTLGTVTCSPAYDEKTMDVYYPDWSALISDSTQFRVVACDMLVTYEGATIDNSGSLAIANVDDELYIEDDRSLYSTLASLPFDKYRGRLASEGQTEGGGHWHFIPSSDDQLSGDSVDARKDRLPRGLLGVAGYKNDQIVRIECHYMVNFFSHSPQYDMKFPPPITGYSPLLWMLRTEVPLVSSNDLHGIIKNVKKGLGAGIDYLTDPKIISLLGAIAALL